MFTSRLCVAHVNAGKGLDYFNNFMKPEVESVVSGKKPYQDSIIPISAVSFVLRRHEELLPQCKYTYIAYKL